MAAWRTPTRVRTTPCCWSRSAGPEQPEDVVPFLQNVTGGRGIPRERLEEVGEHYFRFGGRSPINDQNRAFLTAIREDLAGAGIDLPVYWGNRNWVSLPRRRAPRDARRRDHPGRLLRDVGVLLLLRVPAVPREPRRGRRRGRGRPAPGQAAALLQPPRLRGVLRRRHAHGARGPARPRPRRRAPGLRDALGARRDERAQRSLGRGVRRTAPQRRRRDHRPGPAGDRAPAPAAPRLLLAVRLARRRRGSSPTSTTTSRRWPRPGPPGW